MTFNSITPGSVDHFAAAMMIVIMIECKGGGGVDTLDLIPISCTRQTESKHEE